MGKQRSQYEEVLDKTSIWIEESLQQDTLSLMEIVDKAKAYLHAAEDLTSEEIRTLERFLLKDIQAFAEQLSKDADESVWWQTTKHRFWQLLSVMSDKNQLEMVEMQLDIAKSGEYKSGDLIAIGKLACQSCGHSFFVDHVQRLLACNSCGGDTFSRVD